MQINEDGLDLLKLFEGRLLTTYLDKVGVPTIGFGHTGPDVVPGLTWTPEHAEEMLLADLARVAYPIEKYLTVQLTENQFSALCCLCFNVGYEAVAKSKTLELINEGRDPSVEWLGFCYAGGKPSGALLNRRKTELTLYKTP